VPSRTIQPQQAAESLTIRRISDLESFTRLKQAWDVLLARCPAPNVFLTWEWSLAWWSTHADEQELWLITAWQEEVLVGIAPLMRTVRRKYGMKMRILSNLGDQDTDLGGFIVQDGERQICEAMIKYLIRCQSQWDLLFLTELTLGGLETCSLISGFEQASFHTFQIHNSHCYLHIQEDWHSYLQRLSKSMRRDVVRKVRRMEKGEEFAFIRHIGNEVTWEDFLSIFQVNENGRYPHKYHSVREQKFQRELFERMAQRDWMDISFLIFGGQPVAYFYSYTYQNKYYGWRMGFDTQYEDLSVGTMLLAKVVKDCFEREYEEIDFLRGDEGYKKRWTREKRTYTEIRVVPPDRLKALIVYIWLPRLLRLLIPGAEQLWKNTILLRFFSGTYSSTPDH
jgi:CelD/BcsL family acetyltransferase involved in cellulose biosynthesis